MRPVGRMQTMQCVVSYADAGRRCTDSDQCAGECRVADAGPRPTEGTVVAGQCQATSDRFGCFTRVEDEVGSLGATFNAMASSLEGAFRQLEQEKARGQAILDGMTDAVVGVDHDLNATSTWNNLPAARLTFATCLR